jgi:hypothetical protein
MSVRRHLIEKLARDFQLCIADAADIANTDVRHIRRLIDLGVLRAANGETRILPADLPALDRRTVLAGDLIDWLAREQRRLSALLDERSG